jgi:hypothetical protein
MEFEIKINCNHNRFLYKKIKKFISKLLKMNILNSTIVKNNQTNDKGFDANMSIYSIPLRTFGLLTHLINIIIFSDKKFKDSTFKYLLYHSICEFTYLTLASLTAISYCGSFCDDSFKESLLSKIIELYIDDYLTSSLAIFAVMIEIMISFHRYLIVSNSSFCGVIKNGSPLKITLLLFSLSLFFYLPVLIFFRIKQSATSAHIYQLVKISEIYSYFSYIVLAIRGPIFTLILTIINYFTLIKFKKQMVKKKTIKLVRSKFNN